MGYRLERAMWAAARDVALQHLQKMLLLEQRSRAALFGVSPLACCSSVLHIRDRLFEPTRSGPRHHSSTPPGPTASLAEPPSLCRSFALLLEVLHVEENRLLEPACSKVALQDLLEPLLLQLRNHTLAPFVRRLRRVVQNGSVGLD